MDVVAAIFQTRLSADYVRGTRGFTFAPCRRTWAENASGTRDVAIVISVKVGLSAPIGHVDGASSQLFFFFLK